jgi:hypothetical protein
LQGNASGVARVEAIRGHGTEHEILARNRRKVATRGVLGGSSAAEGRAHGDVRRQPGTDFIDGAATVRIRTNRRAVIRKPLSRKKLPERARELHRWAMSLHPVTPRRRSGRRVSGRHRESDHLLGSRLRRSSAPSAWLRDKLQIQLLALSRNHKQFVAEKSFHAVTIDQPDIIVSATQEVIGAVRRHSALATDDAAKQAEPSRQ